MNKSLLSSLKKLSPGMKSSSLLPTNKLSLMPKNPLPLTKQLNTNQEIVTIVNQEGINY